MSRLHNPPRSAAWTNSLLKLYHATVSDYVTSIAGGINLTYSRHALDFGRGFYTTTNEGQAVEFARTSVLPNYLRRNRHSVATAVVVRLTVSRDALASLETLWFVRGTPSAVEYWTLVEHFRNASIATRTHERAGENPWYDLVVGPVALRWGPRRLAKLNADQASFHTQEGFDLLDGSPQVILPC